MFEKGFLQIVTPQIAERFFRQALAALLFIHILTFWGLSACVQKIISFICMPRFVVYFI